MYKQQFAYETNRHRLTREIAHELKTPLAITKRYVENWEYLYAEKRKDYSQAMLEEMNHMNTLVMDLLELSRFEAKAKELHLETVDLYALTQSVLKRMESEISKTVFWFTMKAEVLD